MGIRPRVERKILVVYAQEQERELFTKTLLSDRIIFMTDGQQALDEMSVEIPDLLFFYLWSPNLNGFTFCEQLAQIPLSPAVLVIVYGSMPAEQAYPALKQRGAAGYLQQPFYQQEILEARNTVLQGNEFYPAVSKIEEHKDTHQRKNLGRWGEAFAAHHLEKEGYQIIERNWRCNRGEIDLVVQGGEILVFVEVKTRRGRLRGAPEAGLTAAKAEKLLQLAQLYLYEKRVQEITWRVDLVAVELDRQGKLLRCDHIRNAVPGW